MTQRDPAITVEHLSKKFCRSLKRSLWYGVRDLASELTGRRNEHRGLRTAEFWALEDVNFELYKGEILGLVGPNGAGKSTLLKILTGVVKPDHGTVTVRGNVQALISLGIGFNPVLTGRENIYVNAAILGISGREVTRQFEEIVAFAELPDFIDTPVMSYSTGMKARLGFATAVFSRPDILLVDEVLSVGDLRFRRKALEKMLNLLNSGVTVVFVSHSLDQVERICSRAVYLSHGHVRRIGKAREVVLEYMRETLRSETGVGAGGADLMESANPVLPEQFVVEHVTVTDAAGTSRRVFKCRDDVGVSIDFLPRRVVGDLRGTVQLCRLDGSIMASSASRPIVLENGAAPRTQRTVCLFRSLPLNEGSYHVSVTFEDSAGRLFAHSTAASFDIRADVEELAARGSYQALLALESEWQRG